MNKKVIEPPTYVIYSGNLKRKGAFLGIIHNCFCELSPSQLYVKKAKESEKYEFVIEITPDTKVEVVNEKLSRLIISNSLNEKSSTFTFLSPDSETIASWAIALRSCVLRPPPGITIDSFDIISVIGRGFYGKVMLVKNKVNGDYYAMKTIRKNRLFKTKKIYTVMNERNILVKVNHPFVVKLFYSFQTDSKFYLILEYVPGGELFKHLKEKIKLTPAEARIYLAEIGLAMEYLHSMGIVYRDIKTENILLDKDGHIKITDFGLSKDISLENENTNSFCGTPEYIAPEIISRDAYSYTVDWWSFGILAYEMLYGCTPFYSVNRSRLLQQILREDIAYPPGATQIQKNFIGAFLIKDPAKRATFDSMKNDPFWDGLNFDDVLQKKIKPSFIPDLATAESTNNFDEEFTQEIAADSLGSPAMLRNPNIPGFSYVAEPLPNVISAETGSVESTSTDSHLVESLS